MEEKGRDKRWFSHPLSVAVITVILTAIVTAALVLYLTRMWQVNEKELDVKFDLAREASDIAISSQLKPLRHYDIDWNSSESINNMIPIIIEGQLDELESCNGMRQRFILYFPGNDKLRDEWSDICASLIFYYQYKIIPRKVPFESDRYNIPEINMALKNISMNYINSINKRLDLDLTKSDDRFIVQ